MEYGKRWEDIVRKGFESVSTGMIIDRLYDPVGGASGIRNICDFIAYKKPNIYYIECKAVKGNALSIGSISQYDRLIKKADTDGVRCGVMIWYYTLNKIRWFPIELLIDLKNGSNVHKYKTLHVELVDRRIIEVPFTIQRVYPKLDIDKFLDLYDKE